MKSIVRHYLEREAALAADPLCPELKAFNSDGLQGIWETAISWSGDQNEPVPFWCLVWPGARALSRWIMDHPEAFRGKRVLDAACGSGIAACAAARCGAKVTGLDLDPNAIRLAKLTARINKVRCSWVVEDLARHRGEYDIILAGDVFYNEDLSRSVIRFAGAKAASGVRVIAADPDRTHRPRSGFVTVARYRVPVFKSIEGIGYRDTTILQAMAANGYHTS